jgi:transposase InsO family protein
MSMKNLFDATVANQVKTRLGKLEPQTERRWGKMTAAQMLAHCSVSMQWAVGEVAPEKGALTAHLIGRLVKPMVFRNEDPLRKNSPTAKSLIVADERDLEKERERLSGLIDKFAAGGAEGCTKNPHGFFGKMTPEEWAILMYKHLDHHFRQFGA